MHELLRGNILLNISTGMSLLCLCCIRFVYLTPKVLMKQKLNLSYLKELKIKKHFLKILKNFNLQLFHILLSS